MRKPKEEMDVLKYLVVGTGRCGSVGIARTLTSVGIPCGHESIFDWGGLEVALKRLNHEEPIVLSEISQENCNAPNWIDPTTIIAESSYMAAPFLEYFQETDIIHIVRNPVDVVNSFCNYHNYFKNPDCQKEQWEGFIYSHLPELKDESLTNYDRGCLYYVKWNQMIENKLKDRSYCFYRVEDDIAKLLEFLGVKQNTFFQDKTMNTLKRPIEQHFNVSLINNQNIKKDFLKIGKKYKYNMSKDLLI